MKKTLVAGLVGLLAAATFAGKDNVVVTFYSNGIDTYADGSPVRDGETYVLVYTPADATFQGINADGEAVKPSKVALRAPVAKNGKCPLIQFEIDGSLAATNYPNATWSVYLLDTRTFAKDLDANGQPFATGFGGKVNGYSAVASAKTATQFVSANATTALAATAAPADRGDVKITNIELKGDKVYLTVSGTVASAAYAVAEGTTPDALTLAEGSAKRGDEDGTGEMIIVRPQQPGGAFFKVNRK